jgi:hypothetical protein
VPIIVDPFAKAPGSEAAEVMDRITQVLTMEPPSAAEPVVAAEDQVDILEVLNVAAKAQRKADAKKNASKKARKGKKNGGKKDDNKGSIKLDKKDAKKDKKDGKKDGKKDVLPKDKAAAMKSLKAEIGKLSGLIKKATKIQSELPKKRARLELLKKKLHSAAASTAKDLAGKKAGAQSKTAGEVDGKIKELKEKLAKLEGAKKSLSKSIDGLQSVVKGKQVPASLIAEVESMI